MNKSEKSEVEKLRVLLEKQLKDLQSDISRDRQPKSSPALPDINDQATLESERSFELRIKDRERKLVGKVLDALKKIGDGTYGTCESCAEPIGIKRLKARPVTSYCINCKSEMEAEERREEQAQPGSESSALS
jgi:DnaK suppressor protein